MPALVSYKISAQADWQVRARHGRNLILNLLSLDGTLLCLVSLWVDLNEARVLHVSQKRQNLVNRGQAQLLSEWIAGNQDAFTEACLRFILKPFSYGSNLHGVQALGYFGDEGTRYRLELGLVKNLPVIFASEGS